MPADERELDRLLDLVAEHLDLHHCRQVDERFRAALACEPVDRPPLVVQPGFMAGMEFPEPWDQFTHYTYGQTFGDRVAMMQKQLLDYVVPGLVLRDDSPLAIRNDHGAIQIASLLGGSYKQIADHYPWVEAVGSPDAIGEMLDRTEDFELGGDVLAESLATLDFYHQKLEAHPPCAQGIQVALPDTQGPIDIAEQLWGSAMFVGFYDEPELIDRLMDRIVTAMVAAANEYRKHAVDRLDPGASVQHGYVVPGRLLDRVDTAIMLSPEMYAEHVRPHDARLLREVGGGSIHFCGNGEHLIDHFLEIPDVHGLDFGQPDIMDVSSIYGACRERNVAVTHLWPSAADLVSGQAVRDYPTGAVFVRQTTDFGEAAEVVRGYEQTAA